jgi:chromate reductase, NAD(P)H dehydrogenase (quinone)
MMRLLAISGSLRRCSYNSALLNAAAACASDVDFVFWNALDTIPAYTEDADDEPASVRSLKGEIRAADAVLFATPEYNGSVPGALKNALDWVSRPFVDNPLRGKPAVVIGASQGSFGAVWAQADLRKILDTIGAAVRPEELAVRRADSAFTADGLLGDLSQRAALGAIVATLRRHAA